MSTEKTLKKPPTTFALHFVTVLLYNGNPLWYITYPLL